MSRAIAQAVRFRRFFSFDSPKAIKAAKFNYLNAINYMAPHDSGSLGELKFSLCSHASPGCIALCLGRESGQASMVSAETNWTNSVRDSRERKARYFMTARQAFLCEMLLHIAKAIRYAKRKRLKLCVRPNGATDIAYEGLRIMITPDFAALLSAISGHKVPAGAQTIFSAFDAIQFVDYTKNPKRFDRALPANYYLTFSRSETNEIVARDLLSRGVNVAVVFHTAIPKTYLGVKVIDGDKHDLRHLDPRGGFVIGLLPKGWKAKKDQSGFVVRLAA
jgi:hypothetical protein